MMNTTEHIDLALAALEQASLESEEIPAIIRLAPDADAYVLGNREGYVKLAIASLKAAQGDNQSFKDTEWVGTEELDWGLSGFRYDSEAHTYLRPPKTPVGKVRDKFFLVLFSILGIAIVGIFSIGLVEFISWFKR